MRVLSAKPSSCAVERVWSHFRDVFSPKRRSLLSTTLRRLVFVKLNMHLLPHDSLAQEDMDDLNECDENWVQSIVEATEQFDPEGELQKVVEQANQRHEFGANRLLGHLHESGSPHESDEEAVQDEEDAQAASLDF